MFTNKPTILYSGFNPVETPPIQAVLFRWEYTVGFSPYLGSDRDRGSLVAIKGKNDRLLGGSDKYFSLCLGAAAWCGGCGGGGAEQAIWHGLRESLPFHRVSFLPMFRAWSEKRLVTAVLFACKYCLQVLEHASFGGWILDLFVWDNFFPPNASWSFYFWRANVLYLCKVYFEIMHTWTFFKDAVTSFFP